MGFLRRQLSGAGSSLGDQPALPWSRAALNPPGPRATGHQGRQLWAPRPKISSAARGEKLSLGNRVTVGSEEETSSYLGPEQGWADTQGEAQSPGVTRSPSKSL